MHPSQSNPHHPLPIKSLARRVYHIMSQGGTINTPIYCYRTPFKTAWQQVPANAINHVLKQAAGDIGLYTLGYSSSDVSSHSLRAGGAMAMHLNGISTTTIQKIGRWRSPTFLHYIHEQISAFSDGVSIKMSQDIAFRNIAGPSITQAAAA